MIKTKMKSVKNGNLFLCIAMGIMVILYISSSQTYEQQSTIPVLTKVLKNEPLKKGLETIQFSYAGHVQSIEKHGYFKFVEFFIRKGAHFFSYFLLSGSFFLGLQPKVKNLGVVGLVSWLSATGYAGIDEYHQKLTGGRTPLFEDVMLDSAGALTAVILCVLYHLIHQRKKT